MIGRRKDTGAPLDASAQLPAPTTPRPGVRDAADYYGRSRLT